MPWYVRLLSVVFILAATTLSVSAAEEGTVRATSAWVAEGRYFEIQEGQALFVGAFAGVMYVETKQGTMDAAKLLCPGMVEINLTDGKQSGEGRCIITAQDGARVYATWRCAGQHFVGCTGTFTLTGGSGRFKGITGHSAFEIRSQLGQLAQSPGEESVRGAATGIATWSALTYKIP